MQVATSDRIVDQIAKPAFLWFMQATAEKDEMKTTFLAYYLKSNHNLQLSFI